MMMTSLVTSLTIFCCLVAFGTGFRFFRSPHVDTNAVNNDKTYSYETKYFEQKIDHFSFTDNQTYSQRYLINSDYWSPGAPIFFYTGNEGDITWFCNNTGFIWDIAPDYKALIIFAEHRYYGTSQPFGSDSYSDLKHLGYLTSEQALADFVVLINYLRGEYGDVPVVAFGGSYGGMLAAWIRMKYPSAVVGSIAASAPIWLFQNLTDCGRSYQIISSTIKGYSSQCAQNILNSWSSIQTLSTKSDTDGLSLLSTTFTLCQPLKDVSLLLNWLEGVWFNLAETNYPYATDFLEPLPPWPLKVVCQKLSTPYNDDLKLVQAIADALQVYHNFTGQEECVHFADASESLGEKGWSFQACTEMIMPMCSDGINDVFPKQPWSLSSYISDCQKSYPGVLPLPYWIEEQYNGKNLTGITNIVFSNGDLDPWSAGGVLQSLSDSLVAVIVKDGAHHLDLRASDPSDTQSVKDARKIHRQNISKWLMEFEKIKN